MRRGRLALVSSALPALVAAGAAGARPQAHAATVKLGASANKTTIHPAVGDSVVIVLADCLDCGDRWIASPAKRALRPASATYQDARLPKGQVGGIGKAFFRFKVHTGGGLVLLEYQGPAGSTRYLKEFKLTIAPR